MFIWGTRTKQFPLAHNMENKTLCVTYSYFSFFYFLSICWGFDWFIVADKRSEDTYLSYEEVKRLYSPAEPPSISVWERWGLIIAVTVVGMLSSF